jgi:hypothetical protein
MCFLTLSCLCVYGAIFKLWGLKIMWKKDKICPKWNLWIRNFSIRPIIYQPEIAKFVTIINFQEYRIAALAANVYINLTIIVCGPKLALDTKIKEPFIFFVFIWLLESFNIGIPQSGDFQHCRINYFRFNSLEYTCFGL